MKKTIEEYKKIFKEFLSDKKYMIVLVLVSILGFGFAITHKMAGVDDLCADRYVSRNIYIITIKVGNMDFI